MSNIFQKFLNGLSKTRETIFSGLFNDDDINEDFYEELEEALILADTGIQTTQKLIGSLQDDIKENKIKSREEAKEVLKRKIASMFCIDVPFLNENEKNVILVVGVNGVGKTTTIGKMAHYYKNEDKTCLIAAADTFRAAACEQLKQWADRNDIPVISHKEGADPAAVVFDAVKSFAAKNRDILLIDTAGRLHNKVNLMNELTKIKRVVERELPDAHIETLIVLDATTGQNAILQVKAFMDSVDISGIVLTKLDGTAKGGIAIAIEDVLNVPIRFIGFGEKIDDLQTFNPEMFAESLI